MILDEKRAFKRASCTANIQYKTVIDNKTIKGDAATRNISLGGVYFESLYHLNIGQKIELNFMGILMGSKIFCEAVVVRLDKISGSMIETFGVAAEFIDLKNDIKKEILNIISKK